MRGDPRDGGRRRSAAAGEVGRGLTSLRRAAAAGLLLAGAIAPLVAQSQDSDLVRLVRGRFTIVSHPRDSALARVMVESAERNDTFPGLPRSREAVRIDVAPDAASFRALIGPSAPEWGVAVAFPQSQRIVMQGRFAGVEEGNPIEILRHEIAHLALQEAMGNLPPRWFDEGYAAYAAREWGREEALSTNLALVLRGIPSLDSLNDGFYAGAQRATGAYALAYRAVAELAALDRERGLAPFFEQWRRTRSMDAAIRAAYGMTLSGFEERWRTRTRRRYGALALVTDVAIVGAGVLGLLIPLQRLQRRRRRQRLEAMREAELEAERARRERALEEILRDSSPAERSASDPEIS